MHCKDPQHLNDISNYTEQFIKCISESVNDNIPFTSPKQPDTKSKHTPGWNEQVKPFKQDADFYLGLWLAANKPQNTELHWAMRRSKNKYHYAVRDG